MLRRVPAQSQSDAVCGMDWLKPSEKWINSVLLFYKLLSKECRLVRIDTVMVKSRS